MKGNDKIILVDVTSFLGHNVLSGVQRVVIEFTKRLYMARTTIKLFKYDNSSLKIVDTDSFFKNCYNSDRVNDIKITSKRINPSKITSNYILLDIDSVWASSAFSRPLFYNILKENHATIISMIHDLIPITHPLFFSLSDYDKKFLFYIASVIKYSDKIIVTSNSTKNRLLKYLTKCGIKKEIYKVPLGADLKPSYDIEKVSKKVIDVSKTNFLLSVATIEPRKNHILLLKAFEKIAERTSLSLILVGRKGWLCDETLSKIRNSKFYNNRLFFFCNANNDEIIYFYQKAYAFVYPSFVEGYGLPLVEALYYKCPVFASNIDVFKEISNNLAVCFNNKSEEDLSRKIIDYWNNSIKYKKIKQKVQNYRVLTWDDSFRMLMNILNS